MPGAPPWSIATSTTTEPLFIDFIISFDTNFGASAPGIKTPPINGWMKNALVNGVKECIVREADNQTTRFGDVPSFSYKSSEFKKGLFFVEKKQKYLKIANIAFHRKVLA